VAAPGATRLDLGPALLERAVGYTRGCLALVRPDLLDAPTPCTDWDLRTLLRHLDDSLAAFTEAGSVGAVAPSPPVEPPPLVGPVETRDVVATSTRASALLAAWTDPPYPAVEVAGHLVGTDLLAGAGALEVAVHGWDVSVACGAPRPLPALVALDLLDLVPLLVGPADRPLRFAPPVAVRRSAAPSARLLAALGRVSPGT